jgi:hypothetical protein
METSLESVVNTGDVEESVTQVLTHSRTGEHETLPERRQVLPRVQFRVERHPALVIVGVYLNR